MYLVHDVHTVTERGGRIHHLIADITDIVNAVVRGGVHLKHIGGAAVFNRQAGGTPAAGASLHGLLAVHGLGKNLGAGGFTRTAGAAKKYDRSS